MSEDLKAKFRAAAAQRGLNSAKDQLKAIKAQKAAMAAAVGPGPSSQRLQHQQLQQKPAPKAAAVVDPPQAPGGGALPADFFQKPAKARLLGTTAGFFSDKAADAQARGVKLPTAADREAEFRAFTALIDEELKQQAVEEAEEAEVEAEEKADREAFLFQRQQQRLELLRQRKALLLAKSAAAATDLAATAAAAGASGLGGAAVAGLLPELPTDEELREAPPPAFGSDEEGEDERAEALHGDDGVAAAADGKQEEQQQQQYQQGRRRRRVMPVLPGKRRRIIDALAATLAASEGEDGGGDDDEESSDEGDGGGGLNWRAKRVPACQLQKLIVEAVGTACRTVYRVFYKPTETPPSWKPAYVDDFNDLDVLLKERSTPEKWVSLFCFSVPENRTSSPEEAAFFRLALNTLYSYHIFGQASSEIVAAITPKALAACRKFRLPCYNASKYAWDSRSYYNIGWAKIKLTRDILKLGFNVHLSDLDMFSWSNGAADGSMMQENWVHQDDPQNAATRRPIYIGNTGVVFLRANSRTVGFMESLLQFEGRDYQDQYIATFVAYKSWAPCTDEAACLAARARGMAAVQLHPSQFAGSNCLPEAGYRPCAPRRFYVHAVCRISAVDKEGFLRYAKAMFIRAGGSGGDGDVMAASLPPDWDDPLFVGEQDNGAIAASGLPCPPNQQRAYNGWLSAAGGAVEGKAHGGADVSRQIAARKLLRSDRERGSVERLPGGY
ncbi:hypothetical protein VOLCADRAFT_89702 [Volvox carteri f. nagariensis]|uniref:Nucleotide-diphospho-sugar transferase domain-containing protein n=1 Tax=Volvox carteri f. nagariensis TaxID=3068 RepID=D8TRV3_VOLCA|nr:uncharacterized protein VOLCADRAFT_89702 [Volvox carteri f. nagariensis]EFJ49710.1 hypothetical protein VOLCADRAFT_89702 [Volvox carteri f. nagariensis]|eukprot:XP_002949217.1 hypothetical protein VOLCADRAFT_89702 [Volvox carteri f. nagariensis]